MLPPLSGGLFFLTINLGHSMNIPNREHNSGKPAKRKLKPAALRARKEALKALKRKLLRP